MASTARFSRPGAVAAVLHLVLLAGCGADADSTARVECGLPVLASTTAAPFEWVEVAELPDDFGSAVAEVTAVDSPASTLTPVVVADGLAALRVPLHPSFRIDGGEVRVRIRSDMSACDPISLTIVAIDPAPGAMEETTGELRALLDEMMVSGNPQNPRIDPERLARRGGDLPLLGLSALLATPSLERLEGLMEDDAIAMESAEEAETMDALAGHLQLPRRMRELRSLAGVVRELTGNLTLTVPPPSPAGTSRRSGGPDEAFRFASYARSPGANTSAAALQSEPEPGDQSCPEGQENFFSIDSPAQLDDYMRAQDKAARFVAGAADEEGGSATGTLFGDVGEVMTLVEMAGKGGKAVSEAWEVFSDAVLMTKTAAAGILPSDMELAVTASPAEFDEDSDETGSWTASAKVTSDGLDLAENTIEEVTEMIAEQYAGRFLDNVTKFEKQGGEAASDLMGDSELSEGYGKFFEEAGKEVDNQLFRDRANEVAEQEVGEILERLGATEVADGFRISGDCWNLDDLSASDGEPTASGDARPPLVTGHLSGGAVEFVGDGDREFEVVDVGSSRLEVRTAEGYAKQSGRLLGSPVGTSYAFGGTQYVGHTTITVEPIDIAVNPALKKVEPGEAINYDAVVRNAVDPSVEWTSPTGGFVNAIDMGDGTHKATFLTPESPEEYPVTIEVVSTSSGGAREDGVPIRKGVAHVQLTDPIIEIRPNGSCVEPGETEEFDAQVLGAPSSAQAVVWSRHGTSGTLDEDGVFRAGRGEGTAVIEAEWVEDREVSASVEVQVREECSHFAYDVSGALAFHEEGEVWGVMGIPSRLAPSHLQVPAGMCLMQISLEAGTGVEGSTGLDEEIALGFSIAFQGEPREGTYGVGRRPRTMSSGQPSISIPVASVPWREELARPGIVFANLGVGMKIDEDGSADGFTSRGGTFTIDDFDGERIEGHFNIALEEISVEYPHETTQRSANVRGHFSHPLNTGGMQFPDFYQCGP